MQSQAQDGSVFFRRDDVPADTKPDVMHQMT